MAAPVYRYNDHNPHQDLINNLWAAARRLEQHAPKDLYVSLTEAIRQVELKTIPTKNIIQGQSHVGYGIDKSAKAIACDNVVTIIKQIKAIKAW